MSKIPYNKIVQDMPPVGGFPKFPVTVKAGVPKGFTGLQIWAGFFVVFLGATYYTATKTEKENNIRVQRSKELSVRSDVIRLLYNNDNSKIENIDKRKNLAPFWKTLFDFRPFEFADEVARIEKQKVVDKYREFELAAQFEGYRICEDKGDSKCISISEIDAFKALFN